VLQGQKEQRARWKRGIAITDHTIGDALGQLYAADSFPPAAKERIEAMVANIKAVFRDHIAQADWMTPATREKAMSKLDRFRAKLGYPSKWKDYAGLELKRDDYFGNVSRAEAWEISRELNRIGKPVDRDEWYMTASTVNAYFDQTKNEIVFPAGILQPPFFDMTMDDAVNYGATGATIGHEMTHGFDSDGRKYDADGNLTDWWTEADAKEYERRAEIVVQQFNALEGLPGVKVNGKLTLPENIADLGGLVLAYEALQRALAADPTKRKSIDGLTPEQRFFISYAQSWAALQRPEGLRQQMTSDPHAPDHLRAVAPLQNLATWYQAFDVKAGAKLWIEPSKRAVIW
jgi:putative endopeptidase